MGKIDALIHFISQRKHMTVVMPDSQKTIAISVISAHFNISVSSAAKAALDWMQSHPNWQWVRLHQWVIDDNVDYSDRQLVPAVFSAPEALASLREQMQGKGGLDIRDRRHRLSVYRECFVGQEAVEWLMQNHQLSREEAVRVGRRLMRQNAIRHVADDQDFADEFYFYSFT